MTHHASLDTHELAIYDAGYVIPGLNRPIGDNLGVATATFCALTGYRPFSDEIQVEWSSKVQPGEWERKRRWYPAGDIIERVRATEAYFIAREQEVYWKYPPGTAIITYNGWPGQILDIHFAYPKHSVHLSVPLVQYLCEWEEVNHSGETRIRQGWLLKGHFEKQG